MIDDALNYARRAWPVFPVHVAPDGPSSCSCGDTSCGRNAGKHPRTPNGLTDATTDTATISAWWRRWPDANIGLRTGVAFDVLDLDGIDACDALDDAQPDAPPIVGPMVRTGRGVHIYLAASVPKSRNGVLNHVDYKGVGGYVIAPPSLHQSGARYEWTDLDVDTPLTESPAWLADLVLGPRHTPVTSAPERRELERYGRAALEGELGRLLMAREGQRNEALNASAFALGQLVGGGHLDSGTVVDELLFAARRIGLGDIEAERTIASGLRAGIAKPRAAA
jgi:hypothetical protein